MRTWQLVNLSGDPSLLDSRLDVSFDPSGRLIDLQSQDALDQRVRVATIARKNQRALSMLFGTFVWRIVAKKSIAGSLQAELATESQNLVRDLKQMQANLQRRMTLAPNEILNGIVSLDVQELNYGHYIINISLNTLAEVVQVQIEV